MTVDSNALDLAQWDWAQIVSTTIIVFDYTIKVIAVGVIPENRRPSSSSAWLLLILFLPVVGIPLFLMLGSPYITGRREKIQEEANTRLRTGHGGHPGLADLAQRAGDVRRPGHPQPEPHVPADGDGHRPR